ncbi:hypothetical protein QBC39DRAFT_398840 [Podospora conica]|nr:hypothetical protein QBC39DRAFT_398840 [Schizothecium conicum]
MHEVDVDVAFLKTSTSKRNSCSSAPNSPGRSEYSYFRQGLILFTYLHLAAEPELTRALVRSGITAVAYETVQLSNRALPLLAPISEVAGRLPVIVGANTMLKPNGGPSLLIPGVPGTSPARVTVLGGGVAGTNAAAVAIGLGADVTILDTNITRLRELDAIYAGRIKTIASNAFEIEHLLLDADLDIGSVLIPGAQTPKLGGCFEDSHPTTYADPTFPVHGSLFYCVGNMPSDVLYTSTYALTNAILLYTRALANLGCAYVDDEVCTVAKRGKLRLLCLLLVTVSDQDDARRRCAAPVPTGLRTNRLGTARPRSRRVPTIVSLAVRHGYGDLYCRTPPDGIASSTTRHPRRALPTRQEVLRTEFDYGIPKPRRVIVVEPREDRISAYPEKPLPRQTGCGTDGIRYSSCYLNGQFSSYGVEERVELRPPWLGADWRAYGNLIDLSLRNGRDLELRYPAAHRENKSTGRCLRKCRGGIRSDNRDTITAVINPQRYTKPVVSQQRVLYDAGGPLGAQDKVYSERPAARRDVDEQGVKVGESVEYRCELVDNDDESRERAVRVTDVAASELVEYSFPVQDLGAKARKGAVYGDIVEVGKDSDDVRQPLERGEGASALEIDEQEGITERDLPGQLSRRYPNAEPLGEYCRRFK